MSGVKIIVLLGLKEAPIAKKGKSKKGVDKSRYKLQWQVSSITQRGGYDE